MIQTRLVEVRQADKVFDARVALRARREDIAPLEPAGAALDESGAGGGRAGYAGCRVFERDGLLLFRGEDAHRDRGRARAHDLGRDPRLARVREPHCIAHEARTAFGKCKDVMSRFPGSGVQKFNRDDCGDNGGHLGCNFTHR